MKNIHVKKYAAVDVIGQGAKFFFTVLQGLGNSLGLADVPHDDLNVKRKLTAAIAISDGRAVDLNPDLAAIWPQRPRIQGARQPSTIQQFGAFRFPTFLVFWL